MGDYSENFLMHEVVLDFGLVWGGVYLLFLVLEIEFFVPMMSFCMLDIRWE